MAMKLIALVLCALLALAPALADGGEILDGRWLCIDIAGNVTEDTPVDPRDDFGLYVNKAWILQAQIPDGVYATGTTDEVARTLQDRQIALMKDEASDGHDGELVRSLYALLSDWEYRDALGVEPLMPSMRAIAAIDSPEALYDFLSSADNVLRVLPIQTGAEIDDLNPDVYVAVVECPKLLMNDSAEYTARTQAGELYHALYGQIAGYMLQRLGMDEAEAEAAYENAVAFEALLAAHVKPDAAHYEADYRQSRLNYYTPGELAALAGDFPIMDVIAVAGMAGAERFQVYEPDYISALASVFSGENLPLARDWLAVRNALASTDLLDRDARVQVEAFINGFMGISGTQSEDDYLLQRMLKMLPVPMDNLYIRAYCTERQREDILQIVGEVREAYRDILGQTDWLSEQTRARAIEKLDALHIYAVYPDELGDWSGLDIPGKETGANLLQVYRIIKDYTASLEAGKVGTAVDKDKWDQMSLTTASVNAAYSPQLNTVAVLAGILDGDIYNEDMSYEQKLGGIGATIGHEISHAFDTAGAQYDKDGALANWWTDEDYAAFQQRAQKLADWFDGFIPFEGADYSGQKVKGEVIADMGGVRCMLHIAAQREDFDYDAFFRQYAMGWRFKGTLPGIITLIDRDVHPMSYMRVNATLAQFDEFDDCYGIREGDGMYIAPEDRVAVW